MPQSELQTGSAKDSSRVRFSVVALLCGLAFLMYYDRQCIVRAQESIQKSLAIDDRQMGLVFGAFWLAYAVFEIPGGWLGDRIGARFTLSRIVLAWSLFTVLTGAATGFYSLIAYRLLFGVGEAGAFPNIARVQSQWLPKAERARAGGAVWFSARCGAAFAPLLFGTMTRGVESWQATVEDMSWLHWLANVESWRIGFFVSGLVGVVWCLAFYPWFRDDPAHKKTVSAAELQHIEQGRGSMEGGHSLEAGMWGRLVSSPSLWAIGLYYLCGSFGWSFYVSWMPRYMKEVQGVKFSQSEWSSAWPLLCGGIACLVGGVLSDMLVQRTGWRRFGRAVFPVTGCLVAAASMLAMPYAKTPRDATLLMCLASFAFDFGQAANWSAIVDIGGRNAGVAMGFINTIGCIGNTVQPYIGAWLFNTLGWDTLFGVYAVAYLLAMSMWAFINPLRRFYDER